MARAVAIVLALALTAAGGWALWRAGGGPAPPASSNGAGEPAAPLLPAAPLPAPEIVPRASRDVTPPGVTPGPLVTGPLIRVPAAPRPAAEPPPAPRLERLFRPVVDGAGSLTTSAGRLSIANIDALPPEARCGAGEAAWPCGRIARAALSRFIRGRAIECRMPPGADELPEIVSCSVGGADIGEWLVRQGWARPAGGAYAEAAAEARAERRGLWGAGPRR